MAKRVRCRESKALKAFRKKYPEATQIALAYKRDPTEIDPALMKKVEEEIELKKRGIRPSSL